MIDPDRTRYSPTPGTERCRLCGEVLDSDHVRHPFTQKFGWLWDSSRAWRILIVVGAVWATVMLAALIAAVRTAVTS